MTGRPDLEAIRERLDAATPGPWTAELTSGAADRVVAPRGDVADCGPRDAEFIAHSREDVPRLLGIVDRLLAIADEWDVKGRGIAEQIEIQDCDGALAGFKMIGAQNCLDHAHAIREAVGAEFAEAAVTAGGAS